MENKNCPLCAGEKLKKHTAFKNYAYVKCVSCGLIFQRPMPSEKELFSRYLNNYFDYEMKNHRNFLNLMKLSLNDINFFDEIQPLFKGKKRFLDIGCATGLLLEFMKKNGWEEYGIDICEASVNYAQKELGVNALRDTLFGAAFDKNYFDVIHFSHLIEHLPRPNDFIKEVYKILKPGGYVMAATPRTDSFQARFDGGNWRNFSANHICLFSKKTLKTLFEKNNFNILKLFSWGGLDKRKAKSAFLKKTADFLAKKLNIGDVMFILAQK